MGAVTFDDEPPLPKGPKGTQMLPPVIFDDAELPKSGGAYAAKELPPEQITQGERRRKLMELVEARGEPGYGDRFKDNFTFGLNRPLGGVASVLGGGSWKAGVGAEEDYIKRAEANTNPWLGFGVDVLGGMTAAGPGRQLARSATNIAQQAPRVADKVARWLAGSTGSSAIEGAARGSESAENAVIGGLIGAGTGKIASSTVGALTDRLASKATREAVSESSRMGGSQAAKDASGVIFDRLDNAGIHFSGTVTPDLANKANAAIAASAYSRNVPDEVNRVVKEINDRVQQGAMTYGDVRKISTQLSNLKAHNDPGVRDLAGNLANAVDDFMTTARATIPPAAVGRVNVNDLAEAKNLWRRGSQAENVEYTAARDMLATNNPTATRQGNFQEEHNKIIDPNRFSTHQGSPGQVAQIRDIAVGNPALSDAAATTNKWSNNLLGYGSIGTAGGLAALGTLNDPYGVSSAASGTGATAVGLGLLGKKGAGGLRKMVEEKGAERVNTLIRDIVTGSPATPAVQSVPREALARVLAAEQVGRGASRYSSNWYDKE